PFGGCVMSIGFPSAFSELHLFGLEQVRKRWGWYLALGILLVVLGTVALGSSVLVTMVSMLFIGYLMIVAGIFEIINAFANRAWGGFFLDLLMGVLYVVAGFFIVVNPGVAALTLTFMIAVLLVLSGVFRIVVALSTRFHHRTWLLLHGAID